MAFFTDLSQSTRLARKIQGMRLASHRLRILKKARSALGWDFLLLQSCYEK